MHTLTLKFLSSNASPDVPLYGIRWIRGSARILIFSTVCFTDINSAGGSARIFGFVSNGALYGTGSCTSYETQIYMTMLRAKEFFLYGILGYPRSNHQSITPSACNIARRYRASACEHASQI